MWNALEEQPLKSIVIVLLLCLFSLTALAQPKWKRSDKSKTLDMELFPSTMTANFLTTETLKKGDMEYEISHRFKQPLNVGFDGFWGLEGPVNFRMALSYGITNRFMATFGISNLQNNLDLQLRYKLLQIRSKALPSVLVLRGGIAVATKIPDALERSRFDSDNFQYYAQLAYNTMLFNKKVGIGLVPSYLYNSIIFSVEKQYTFSLGNYAQWFINGKYSLWVEYNPVISGYQGIILPEDAGDPTKKSYNALAIGMDIGTGGHVFRLFTTNSTRLNPSQYLVGAEEPFEWDNLKFAFAITRHF